MALLLVLLLSMAAEVTAEFHQLSYHELMSNGYKRPLKRVVDGYVGHVHFVQYNITTGRIEPKQDWMVQHIKEDPQRHMNTWADDMVVQRMILEGMGGRTTGAHWVQRFTSCMWDDETGEVRGQHQFAYNGTDFIGFYLEMKQWVALTREADDITRDLNRRESLNQKVHNYLTQECPERLKMYLENGRSQLLRKEPPTMFLLQKSSSSPITCVATGFIPKLSELFWRKDGKVLNGDQVLMPGPLPNHDGTFQRTAELLSPPDRPEDWTRYECVFWSYGQTEVTRRLDEGFDTNGEPPVRFNPDVTITNTITITIILVITITIIITLLSIINITSFILRKKRCDHSKKPFEASEKLVKASSCSSSPSSEGADRFSLVKEAELRSTGCSTKSSHMSEEEHTQMLSGQS